MKFARWVFLAAGIFGLVLLIPLVYSVLFDRESILLGGASAGLFFYTSVFQYVCWQILYLVLAKDPLRYRPIMIPAFLAIAVTPFYPIWLYMYGLRPWIPIIVINLIFALLFVLAFWLTGRETKSSAT